MKQVQYIATGGEARQKDREADRKDNNEQNYDRPLIQLYTQTPYPPEHQFIS
jgi:hypothetical protein